MRTILISDVHGNRPALQAVLDHAYQSEVDEIWYLGDTMGYGPEPYEVWHNLRYQPIPDGAWLAGNNDWGLLKKLYGPTLIQIDRNEGIPEEYEIAHIRDASWGVLRKQSNFLEGRTDLIDHLKSLPVMSALSNGVYLAHGSFEKDPETSISRYTRYPVANTTPAELVSRFEQAAANYPELVYRATTGQIPPRLFAVGHTHRAISWRWNRTQQSWDQLNIQDTVDLNDLEAAPIFVNPGSVGFPRDGSGCPSYVEILWDKKELRFHSVWYEVDQVRNKMQSASNGDNPYLKLLSERNFLIDPKCAQ